MKNAKKAVAMALALTMTASITATAFADAKQASDMPGYDKVSYTEAMDVMVATGVIDGVSGDLQPKGNVTREQAAKIIAFMLEGKDIADMYTTTKYFSDVATTRWSAGYIAYCVEKGIVSGVGGGKFNPTGNVTGYEFAKMLLVSLGYKASTEGYTGTNWTVNVYSDANSAKLFDGVSSANKNKAATREEVCQYAMNALEATMVEYKNSGSNIVIGDTTINVGGSNATAVVSSDNWAKNLDITVSGDGWTVQLGEKYFNNQELKKSSSTDRLARPAHTWSVKAGDIGTYTDSSDETLSVEKQLTLAAALTDNLKYDSKELTDATVYVNGYKTADKNYSAMSSFNVEIGDTVEVFEDNSGNVDSVVVIREQAAEIDEIDDELSSSLTKKGASYGITLDAVEGNITVTGATLYDSYTNDDSKVLAGFDAKTYAEGAVIAYVPSVTAISGSTLTFGDEVLSSYVADEVDGKITSYTANKHVYVGGTKYVFAKQMDGAKDSFLSDVSYTLYLNDAGSVIALTGKTGGDIGDVYYVTGVYSASASYAGTAYYAQAVNVVSGEVSEIKLEGKDDKNSSADVFNFTSVNGFDKSFAGLYTLTDDKATAADGTTMKSGDGKFNMYNYGGDENYDVTKSSLKTDSAYALSADVEKDSTNIKPVGAQTTDSFGVDKTDVSKFYLNTKTAFVSVDGTADSISVATATGVMAMSHKDPTQVIVISADGKNSASYVLYVGTDMDTAIDTSKMIYVSANQDFDTNTNGTYNMSAHFMDGKKASSIVVDGSYAAGFSTYALNNEGRYVLTGANMISSDVTKNTTGAFESLTLNSDNFSADNDVLSAVDGKLFSDVSYAGATVIDTRDDDAIDADVYNRAINSVSSLESALKKCSGGAELKADVYVENGKITFIAVTSVTNA